MRYVHHMAQRTLTTEDGRTFKIPNKWPEGSVEVLVGLDDEGYPVATADGFTYGLTMCCGASFTGTDSGVACRACYDPGAAGNDVPREPISPFIKD